jgi:tetratricopeptide (TPR) repeat protein
VPGHASTSKAIVARSAPQIFNGRDEYVANIVQTLLISDQARVPILGPGGMGKTSVALAVANDATIVQRFEDRRHFVPCEEVTNPAPLVELIALHLGVVLPASNPFQHLLASLYTQFSPCLVVLDNFETPWDSLTTRTETEEIIAQLSSVPTLSLIITMRGETPPFGIDWSYPSSQLLPLPLDAAKATFLKICPSDDEKLEELLTALDCVPLAVTLIAYVGRSSRLSASELLASWKSEQTKLLDLGSPDRLRSVDHSIRLSLESTTMKSSPVALQLLSIVAMLPGGAVLRTLPSLVPSIANLDRATRTLLSVSLAYKGTGGTLRLLSPIRSYIAQHHTPDSISLESLRTFYYKLADQCEGSPGDKDFLRIQDEVALEESNMESVLLNCLSELSDDDAVRAVNNYSWYLYWNHPRFELLEAAINVAQQGNFTELLPQCLQRLGYILISQGEYTRAFTALEEARGLFCVGKNQLEAALCLERHAEILRMQSQNDEARAKLEEVRKEFQAIGNQKGTARCLQCLGDILRMQERYVEARSALEDARELLQELGEPLGAAQCLRSIGLIHFSEEQYSDARTILEDAQNQFQAIGETSGATQCLHYLGDVLLEQGQYEKARVSLEKAREQYQEMGERAGSVECLVSLGEILRREARYDEALSYLDEAYSQFRAIGNRLGIANSLIQIARNCVALDRNSEALKALEEARELYLEIGAFRSMKNCDYLLSSIRVGD